MEAALPHLIGGSEQVLRNLAKLRERLDALTAEHQKKLAAQAAVLDKLHAMLADKEGLIENTKYTMKNLEAAIASSRRPGYFSYWQPNENVKHIESKKELSRLTIQVNSMQKEIDLAAAEVARVEGDIRLELALKDNPTRNLDTWFATYGRPTRQPSMGMASEYRPNPKVYGGTKHHKSYRSLAVTLKPGNLTK
jgi:hypothetical protein